MTLDLFTRGVLVVVAALIVTGCASNGAERDPAAGADHPANPNAPAAPPPATFTMLKLAGPARRAAPATAPTSQPAGAYICPMHPEVTSTAPGICPKCKMKLEQKKTNAPTAASSPPAPSAGQNAHEHDHGGQG
jgi:hypothetical protein